MNSISWYLLQVIAASGLLYGYYHLLLRNKRFHKYNRYYLLGATILSLVIPFLNIPVYFTASESSQSMVVQTLTTISNPHIDNTISFTSRSTGTSVNWKDIVFYVYLLAMAVALARIILSLLRIKSILSKYTSEPVGDIVFVNTVEAGTPFSFLNYMFWNRRIDPFSSKGKQIFRHEMYHITQKHTLDLLFLELVSAICWINPFFHLIKKEVRAIHEFLADEFALKDSSQEAYTELLLMQALNTPLSLVNPFFHNQVKRRILMIIKSEKSSTSYLRRLLAIPLAAMVVLLFAFSYKTKPLAKKSTSAPAVIENIIPLVKADTAKPLIKTDDPAKKLPDSFLVIIDEKVKMVITQNDNRNLNKIVNPDQVESINIIKGETAVSKYGKQWSNGVIEITLKKPGEGKALTTVKTDTTKPHENVPNIIFEKVETEPGFPGGDTKWQQYLSSSLDQGIPSKNGAPNGDYSVVIQFIVNTDGTIKDVKALTKFGYGMEEEAIRVIKQSPNWLPGIQNGKTVAVYKKVVITFYHRSDNKTSTIPVISTQELKNITVNKLLQLPGEAKPVSFVFTIDLPNGDIVEVNNASDLSPKAVVLMKEAKPGATITIDRIRIFMDGKEIKYPAKAYKVIE